MPNILWKVENAGAEKLWNYILAYRRMIGEVRQIENNSRSPNSVVLEVIPVLEQPKTLAKSRRSNKRSLSS